MKKRILTLALTLCMVLAMTISASAATFNDVSDSHWASDYINKAASEKLVNGVGNGNFNPDTTLTKAEWLTMICNLMYSDTVARYNQTNTYEHWYDVYVEVSKSYLTSHMDTKPQLDTFGAPSLQCTRYVMAAVIHSLAKSEGWADSISTTDISNAKSNIADWSTIPAAYQEPVAFCYAAGFINGIDSAGTFSGSSAMTRAQASVVLCRLFDTVNA